MENTFEPIEVDLSYNFKEPSYEMKPVEVDLQYPTDNKIKVDQERSIFGRAVSSLNEWSETLDVSILWNPRSLRDTTNGNVSF